MEFSALTRRVAEYSQIDPADIAADAGTKDGGASASASSVPSPLVGEGQGGGFHEHGASGLPLSPALPHKGGGSALNKGGGSPRSKMGTDRQDKAGSLKGTPISLAAARAEAARKIPVDRGRYQTVRSLEALNAWIARVHDVGHFAIDAKATSIDPMQAEMCGIALALGPNDACYIPLSHKQPGDGAGLFAAGLAPDQIKASDALEALRPLLESQGILKIGFNIKFNAVMFAQHGVTIRNHDDAQLMSYALDAGRNSHGLDALAETWLRHAPMSHGELTRRGQGQPSFDQVAIDK